MLQQLLKDRFKLSFHYETRNVPGYALLQTGNEDGLQRSKNQVCTKFDWRWQNGVSVCGAIVTGPDIQLNHTLSAIGMSMSDLSDFLSRQVLRPVADDTGLRGGFDLRLEWNLESTTAVLQQRAGRLSSGPSLFSALREQLGLTLRAEKVPARTLIIDHAEKPLLN